MGSRTLWTLPLNPAVRRKTRRTAGSRRRPEEGLKGVFFRAIWGGNEILTNVGQMDYKGRHVSRVTHTVHAYRTAPFYSSAG